jgi:transcription elongation GreA/GreB family factor
MTKPDVSLKLLLHQQCLNYINSCIDNAQFAIWDAQQSANNETKSSAGDKHETGRALLQLEQEKNTKQLTDVLALKEKLLKIDPSLTSETVSLGSVVMSSSGNFYIAIAAGKLEVQSDNFFAISPVSPIATKLLGLRANDSIQFNGTTYQIRYVL